MLYLYATETTALVLIKTLLGVAYHRGSIRASHPAAPGLILGVPKNVFILDVAEIYPQPSRVKRTEA